MKYLIHLVFILLPWTAAAQSPVGTWKTVDDDSGDARSYVEIYEKGGMLFGKITKLLDKDPGVLCESCTGAKKGNRFGRFWDGLAYTRVLLSRFEELSLK